MNCNMTQKRELSDIFLLSKESTRQLIDNFPSDGTEVLIRVGKDGKLDYLIPNDESIRKNKLVQLDPCDGKCFLFDMELEDGCQEGNDLVVKKFERIETPCDSPEVQKLISNNVVKIPIPLALTLLKESWCACDGGCIWFV